jgi:cell fate regulator YaaT (PSP1 superfamily)
VTEDKVNRKRKMREIERKANPRDLVMKQVWEAKDLDALITCREKAHELGVRDTKFVKASYNFDGSWITIYYTTDNKKLDLNPLRGQLSRSLRTRIEMQIVGPRDVARMMGGHGACGVPRCCSTFLTDFSPISIRMAKAQGISLSPQEITGMCGRLRCCLIYEYEQYVEARKELPKRGKRVGTPHGEGIVLDQLIIKEAVRVRVGDDVFEVPRHELEPLDELEALQKKAEAGCSKHEGGGCDCGAKNGKSD